MANIEFKPIAAGFKFLDLIEIESIPDRTKRLLIGNEEILIAVKTARDIGIFTNKRMLLVDTQGIFGSKKEYFSLPYKSIATFDILLSTTNAKIKIITRAGYPIKLNFMKSVKEGAAMAIYNIIANQVLSD